MGLVSREVGDGWRPFLESRLWRCFNRAIGWLVDITWLGFEDSRVGIPDMSITCPLHSITVSAEIQSQVPHPSSTFGGNTSTECGLERESQQLRERPWSTKQQWLPSTVLYFWRGAPHWSYMALHGRSFISSCMGGVLSWFLGKSARIPTQFPEVVDKERTFWKQGWQGWPESAEVASVEPSVWFESQLFVFSISRRNIFYHFLISDVQVLYGKRNSQTSNQGTTFGRRLSFHGFIMFHWPTSLHPKDVFFFILILYITLWCFSSSSVCRSRTRSDQKYQTWYLLNVVIGFLQTPSTLCCWANIWSRLKQLETSSGPVLFLRLTEVHAAALASCLHVYLRCGVGRIHQLCGASVIMGDPKCANTKEKDHWPLMEWNSFAGCQLALTKQLASQIPALQCAFSCLCAWDPYVVQRLYSAS